MVKQTKRFQAIKKLVEEKKLYSLNEALELLQKCPPTKFDQSVELAVKLGINTEKSEQTVRGVVSLPHGTGKKVVVLVLAKGDKVKEALDAGADYAGHDELLEKIKGGWTEFDCMISTPDMMREVGKLGKILGPRGLMPTPKAGTVTMEVGKAVAEAKAGKIEFKCDKGGVISSGIGKLSFSLKNLAENAEALLQAITKAKPATAKGVYVKTVHVASTMGPGLRIEYQTAAAQ